MLKRGTPFGVYEIRALIGRGGMGEVYRARHLNLGRTVALKTIRPAALVTHSDPDALRDRFLREMKIHGTLTHPSLVRVYDLGFAEGQPFIAMEFMHGGSLRGRLDSQFPLNPQERIEILTSLADGLEALHKAGIIHRDVKPANVMFDRTGRARLTDFGISRHLDSTLLTHADDFLGTPAYMPREVLSHGESLSAATDVYALGVVAYEMFAHSLPWTFGSLPDLLKQITYSNPEPLLNKEPDADPDLAALVDAMIHPDSAKRRDLSDFRQGLQTAERKLFNLTATSIEIPTQERMPHRTRRESITTKLIIVLMAGSGIWLLLLEFSAWPQPEREPARFISSAQHSAPRSFEPDPPIPQPPDVGSSSKGSLEIAPGEQSELPVPGLAPGSVPSDPRLVEEFENAVAAAVRMAQSRASTLEPQILDSLPAVEQLRIAVTRGNSAGIQSPLWIHLEDAACQILAGILSDSPLVEVPHSLLHGLKALREAIDDSDKSGFSGVFHDNTIPLLNYVENPLRSSAAQERRDALMHSELKITRSHPEWSTSLEGLQQRVRILELATRETIHDTQRDPELLYEETETARRVLSQVARDYLRLTKAGSGDKLHARTLARIIVGLAPRQEIVPLPLVPHVALTAVSRLSLERLDKQWLKEVSRVLKYLPRE